MWHIIERNMEHRTASSALNKMRCPSKANGAEKELPKGKCVIVIEN